MDVLQNSMENKLRIGENDTDDIVYQANVFATSNGTLNAVLHALRAAIMGGKLQIVQSWYQNGRINTRNGFLHWKMDLNKLRDASGESPLHLVANYSVGKEKDKLKLMEFLISEVGCDPNVVNLFGRSPLHSAAEAGYPMLVECLLKNGASAGLHDKGGLTPLMWLKGLKSSPNIKIINLLLEYSKGDCNRKKFIVKESRQSWSYAVLFKPATMVLPGNVLMTPMEAKCATTEDVSRALPCGDFLLIENELYRVDEYNVETRGMRLDRPYHGTKIQVHAYLAGYIRNCQAPYVSQVEMKEVVPGNKFQNVQSKEQGIICDYQIVDPTSDYEIAMKIGPAESIQEARRIAKMWKRRIQDNFQNQECLSGLLVCKDGHCPRSQGMQCLGTLLKLGKALAKEVLGHSNLAKAVPARSQVQKVSSAS